MNNSHDAIHENDAFTATRDLFAWPGDEIVLLLERSGDKWILARGWSHSDCLVDVRRWTFTSPEAVATQVRRLAREDTGNRSRADAVGRAALTWAADQSGDDDSAARLDNPDPE